MLSNVWRQQRFLLAHKKGLEASTLIRLVILLVFLLLVIIIIAKVRSNGGSIFGGLCEGSGGFFGCGG